MSRKSLFGLCSIILILSFPSLLFSQGEAAVLFLRIPPSPALNGMGATGVALPNNDPLGFHYNPAQLGQAARETNFAYQFYPSKTDWLPQFGLEDLTFNSAALNLGYKFRGEKSMSLTLGLGYMTGRINYGQSIQSDITGNVVAVHNSREYYHALGVGAGLDYHIHFNIGLTYKNISSKLGSAVFVEDEYPRKVEANENALDFGALVTVPALTLLAKEFVEKNSFSPYFDVSIGYALANVGGKVEYLSKAQADPLPRTASIGYAFSSGLDIKVGDEYLRLLTFEWSSEANDLLIKRKSNGNIEYQGLFGDIDIWNNVILGKSDDRVQSRYGFRFQFMEFIGLNFGRFNGPGWDGIKTEGYTINMKGILHALRFAGLSGFDYFDFQYSWAKYSTDDPTGPLNKTTYRSITFSIRGLQKTSAE